MAAFILTDTSPERPGARLFTDDLRTLLAAPDVAGELRRVLHERLVLLISAPHVDGDGFLALSRLVGTPRRPAGPSVPGHPDIPLFLTAGRPDAIWREAEDISHILHVDYSHMPAPPSYSIQYQQTPLSNPLPTSWVDMRRVHADLPAAMQQRISGLSAVHPTFRDQVNLKTHREVAEMPPGAREAGHAHPLVCRDLHTGAPYLFLPVRRDSLIPGMAPAESRALLTELWDAVEASPYRYQAPVRTGDIVIWDNVAALHDRPPFPPTADRAIWFITTEGTAPASAFGTALAAE